jgi:universal stress protein A
MKTYHHILLALELIPESDKIIIQKAKELVAQYDAKLTLIHGVEHFANFGAAYSIPGGVDVEEEIVHGAQAALKKLAAELHVPANQQLVKMGSAKHIIVDEA